jgi:cellulose synthase/poly-beta-1,6-N-acetylglucosamine synthase-like glycosyltransferase
MIYTTLLILFYLSLLLCLTSYVFYPVIIAVLSKYFCYKPKKSEITPYVSIIISAYNEEKDIAKKIENTLALDYPNDRFDILIGSDGSVDETAVIVSKYSSVHFYDYSHNRGKTSVQNDLVKESKGEILVFTDAASFLSKDALKTIVRNFADENVGCVAGRMEFVDTENNLNTQSQGIYWNYEVTIRELESRLGSLIGVDGPLYAVRSDCYVPLQNNIISDLITPLLVLKQGKKVILESEAIVEEEPTQKSQHEFNTRRRITLRGLIGVFAYKELLNPAKYPGLSLQIISHKLLRWFIGPLAILNFLTCISLIFYDIMIINLIFTAYVALIMTALLGWFLDKVGQKNYFLAVPYYFFLVNIAATYGIMDFIMKKQATTWSTERNI